MYFILTPEMDTDKENGAFSEVLTLENFKTWSSMTLKKILSLRTRSVNCSIDVLVFEVVFFGLFEKFSSFCF